MVPLDPSLQREELKNVIEGKGAARRIPLMIHEWISPAACKEREFDNTLYLPSLHTLNANVGYGKNLYTTLDGRLKGEPVNKNAGPTNDVRTGVPTGPWWSE